LPPEGVPRPGVVRESSNAIHPFPPVPDRKVTTADENPENFVRAGGGGAMSLIGNRGTCDDEKVLWADLEVRNLRIRQAWHNRNGFEDCIVQLP